MDYLQQTLRGIFFIISFSVLGHAVAQQNIDSLITTWNGLAEQYLKTSETDSACKYGNCSVEMLDEKIREMEDQIQTSEVRRMKYQKAEALSFLVSAYGSSGHPERALECYHDALDIYESFGDGELIYQLHFRMGRVCDLTTQYAMANEYYALAREQAVKNGDLEAQALCYYFMGLNNRYMGNYSEALKYHLQDLEIQEKLDNKKGIGNAYITIAAILNTLKDRNAAFEKLNEARLLFEEIGDTAGIATVYNDLGSTYLVLGDTLRALQSHEQAAAMRNAILNYDGIGASNSYIGNIYLEKGNYEKALHHLQLSEDAFRSNGNLDGIMHTFIQISQVYERKNMLDSALAFTDKAEKLAIGIMNSMGLIKIYSNRGELWFKQGKYTKAINDFQKALKIAAEQKNYKSLHALNDHLAKTYQHIGDYQRAYTYQQLSILYKDSVYNRANLKATMQMDMEYNYQKQQLENKLLQEKKDELTEATLDNQRTQKQLYFAGVIMFLMVSLGLWSRLRFIRRAGSELLQRKEEADRQRMIAETEKIRATKSERIKEQFLANMSHEIRTPMNAIKGITDILIRNEHLPSQEKYLGAIKQSSENLLVILNEILDLSKLEAGKIEPENIPFEPRNVITNIKDILRFKAEEKGLSLTLDLPDDLPQSLCGDPTHLSQILLNLASNAIKFTEKGGVTLKAMLKSSDDNHVVMVFHVIDTGIGIAADKIDHVFDTFTQADTDTTRKYGGTGLGLSICKRLVDLHRGEIYVQSELHKGSTFIVELPFTLAPLVEEEGETVMDDTLHGLKILLAEDNEFNVMVARDVLESSMSDINVDVAGNGATAVSKVEQNQYDLILMDIQMPEMDGYDATKLIRKMAGEKGEIPIIAMTANVMKAEVDRCFDAGMNGYIAKPFEPKELLQTIKKILVPA
ncbi:MAG: tetratricopeptide repeat protein [Bacteroidetes bacterium]|nr:tetratricopeptide repeat protein [Bacteroidota bacterium]